MQPNQTNRPPSSPFARLLAGLGLLLVAISLLFYLPDFVSKMTVLAAIPYAGTPYNQRQEDILGVEVTALKFAADTTGTDMLAAWVSDDYQARETYVRYWLYPRRIWLGDNLEQAAGEQAGVILVLKKCPSVCTPAEITGAVGVPGYRLARQFTVREETVSVLTRVI